MHRCLELARLGAGYTAPNPMVGAILVHEEKIIGEGYHQRYGEAHAEVNCIHQAIESGFQELISNSTLYVSLEPCSHFGKTPPCADLIIKHRIPKVVVGCRDPFKEVNGKGIEKLRAADVDVELGMLESECKNVNKRFFTFHRQQRPYIILKWARTGDGFIGNTSLPLDKREASKSSAENRLLISNQYTNRLVHKWRSEEAAILVGTNTVMLDDPELTTRLWWGVSPIRLVIDLDLQLPASQKVFNDSVTTIIFNTKTHSVESDWPPSFVGKTPKLLYWQVTEDVNMVHQIVNALYQLKILSVIVEGGATLLQSFIDDNAWDEARIITNRQMTIGKGLHAPQLSHSIKIAEETLLTDTIEVFTSSQNL